MTDKLMAAKAILDTAQAKFSDAAQAYTEAPPGEARMASLSRWNEDHAEFNRALAAYNEIIEEQQS